MEKQESIIGLLVFTTSINYLTGREKAVSGQPSAKESSNHE